MGLGVGHSSMLNGCEQEVHQEPADRYSDTQNSEQIAR